MSARFNFWPVVGAVAALALPGTAFAASDVSNSGKMSNQATTTIVAPIASAQTASLISGAISGGFSGGFSGGGAGGGFGGGTGGGFSPGPQSSLPMATTRGMSGGGAASNLGVWAQGTYSHAKNSQVGLEMDGDVYNMVGGADYKLTDNILVGLALGWEESGMDTKYNRGDFSGSGGSVIPYLGVQFSKNWSADLSVGYGWLTYETTRNFGAVKGEYDANRLFTAANLTGNYAFGNWRLQPKAGVSYIHEKQDAYVEQGGGAVDGDTLEFGRATAGSKIGYAIGNHVPYLKVMGEWDFLHPDAVTTSTGQLSSTSDGGGVVGLGYELYSGPFTGSVEANYNSLFREDLGLYTVALRARLEF